MKASDLGQVITHYVNQKGDIVTHKKLQKLLYYVEAWHLVNFDTPILDEDFEAWVHGPVIPSLYQELKSYGFSNIIDTNKPAESVKTEIESIISKNALSKDKIDFLEEVLDKYGTLTSFQLEQLSHSEAPWIEAREGIPPHQRCNNIISKDRMKKFYSSMV